MSSDNIDINAAILQNEVSILPPEHPLNRASRIKREDRASWLDDIQRMTIFSVLLTCMVILGGVTCYEGIINNNIAPDTKHLCQTILSAIVSGGISYVFGRNSKSK